jgi:hypothetical protein
MERGGGRKGFEGGEGHNGEKGYDVGVGRRWLTGGLWVSKRCRGWRIEVKKNERHLTSLV